jgi:integrase
LAGKEKTKGKQIMGIFIPKGAKFYWYKFDYRGERFRESTGKTTKREAEAVEAAARTQAEQDYIAKKALVGRNPDITIQQACERYWREKQFDYVEAGRDCMVWSLAWIADFFECDTPLKDIDDEAVTRMVAKRRGEYSKNSGKHIAAKLVSNGTVNGSVTFPLRRVMNRAGLVWKVQIQIINWKQHVLPTTQERVRSATAGEEAALMSHLGRGYDEAVEFNYLTGLRRMEILGLNWTDIDFFSTPNQMIIRGKGGTVFPIPLTGRALEIVKAQFGRHPVKVFTYEANRTRVLSNGNKIVRGQRYPLTKFGLRDAFNQARERAGVVDYRFHDNRHTAATRLLKRSKNLKLVQKMLRHADIGTTTKYAHVDLDDLAEAMAMLSAPTTAQNPACDENRQNSVKTGGLKLVKG